jgi:hypothetical protein
MPGKALKWGTLVKKNRAANGKIPKTAISIKEGMESNNM